MIVDASKGEIDSELIATFGMRTMEMERKAFTIVELLVVIAITGILAGLTIAAVQSVRESARDVSCKNNLSNLGKTLLQYQSAHRVFPGGAKSFWTFEILKQDNTLEALKEGVSDPDFVLPALLQLRCPSDGLNVTTSPQGEDLSKVVFSNYLGNLGIRKQPFGNDGAFTHYPGFLTNMSRVFEVGPKHISDGLSATAMFSEALHGGSFDRLRTLWQLPGAPYDYSEFELMVEACSMIPADPGQQGWVGNPDMKGKIYQTGLGFLGGIQSTYYNHAMPPNRPSCQSGSLIDSFSTATSNHRSNVNTVFCDGHTSSISDSIDMTVWRAMGSRSGGD